MCTAPVVAALLSVCDVVFRYAVRHVHSRGLCAGRWFQVLDTIGHDSGLQSYVKLSNAAWSEAAAHGAC